MSPLSIGSPRKSLIGTVSGEPNNDTPTAPVPTWEAGGQALLGHCCGVQSTDTDLALAANPGCSTTATALGRPEKPVSPVNASVSPEPAEAVFGVNTVVAVPAAEATPAPPSVTMAVIIKSLRTAFTLLEGARGEHHHGERRLSATASST
jgi:hypothetical protein